MCVCVCVTGTEKQQLGTAGGGAAHAKAFVKAVVAQSAREKDTVVSCQQAKRGHSSNSFTEAKARYCWQRGRKASC